MTEPMTPENAEREKRLAALSSVFAAVLLTAMKLAVGLATNSLGMLSEALHSGLDLLAASLTYFAVRFASIPPDSGHPYGHGKMENLSAFLEALLLLITCAWIIWEAVDRLFFNPVPVMASLLAVLVMLISIAVDFSRSRMLRRMAKKHRSQALEADALHFSTDIWSSLVVLAGLGALQLAALLPAGSALRPWLERADALAALGVSAIVLKVSYSLGKRAVNVLLDAGDRALEEKLRAALEKLPGVLGIRSLRLRHSGPDLFVELSLAVDRALWLTQTLHLRRAVEEAARGVAEHARVSIELLPGGEEAPDLFTRLRGVAATYGLQPHAVEFQELAGGPGGEDTQVLQMHMEFPPDLPLGKAYERVAAFQGRVLERLPGARVFIHLEPHSGLEAAGATRLDSSRIRAEARELVACEDLAADCHNVLLFKANDGMQVSFHCRMRPEATVAQAHELSLRLHAALHERMPELRRVTVHVEPFQHEGDGPGEGGQGLEPGEEDKGRTLF